MILNYDVTGEERKELVKAIAKVTNEKEEYQGAPNFIYKIGEITVDKKGQVEVEDSKAEELQSKLLEEGFEIKKEELDVAIQIPARDFDEDAIQNLHNLLKAKGKLIKKALNIESLDFNIIDERLDFPWFKSDETPEETKTYMNFITALCNMAKSQKRISGIEKEPENEKYAFRCFLLRLGFIGKEYKVERKILLRNLEGNSAFKNPNKGENENEDA